MKVLTRSTFAGVGLGFLLLAACGCANGCATASGGGITMGGAKRAAYDTLSTTEAVLQAAQKLEISLVCNKPGAPPEGSCVPKPLHDKIQADFIEAGEYGQQIVAIVRALPEGSPTPGNVLDLALAMKTLAQRILAALPKSPQADSLWTQLAKAKE